MGLSIVGGESTVNPPADVTDVTDVTIDVVDVPDGPFVCRTNADCAGMPATPLCNTATGRCVECLTTPDDTCRSDRHCHPVSKVCLPGCHDDSGCPSPDASHCLVEQTRCVQCITNAHCSGGNVCLGNVCVPPCMTATDCAAGRLCCSGGCVDATSNLAS